jgi:ribonuclease HII
MLLDINAFYHRWQLPQTGLVSSMKQEQQQQKQQRQQQQQQQTSHADARVELISRASILTLFAN